MPIFTHVIKKRGRFDRAFHFIKLIYSGCHLKEFFLSLRGGRKPDVAVSTP